MLAAALALTVFQSGCFGSFKLTQAVWKFNRDVSGDKWVQWLVFLVLSIVPVYVVATVVDAFVVNSIEFWTGSNPVRADGTPWQKDIRLADGSTARMIAEDENTLRVEHGETITRLRKEAGTITVFDEEGKVLAMIREAENGALERVNAEGEVERIEAWQLAAAGSNYDALATATTSR